LRPRGGEGELLITPTQLASYFRQEAQPWEALFYTKMRFLTGSEVVAERALAATKHLFERFAGDERFLPAVRDMRAKLEHAEAGERNIKTSPGAAYDIDFLTGYLLVKRGIHEKSGTLRERLWRCSAEGALAKTDAALLDHAAELFRTAEHVVRLVTGRAQKWLPATEHARQVTEELTGGILGTHWREGLEGELTCVCREVRAIYERVLA
jgi:glutamine synthetase adenylyltransferase